VIDCGLGRECCDHVSRVGYNGAMLLLKQQIESDLDITYKKTRKVLRVIEIENSHKTGRDTA